MAVTDTHIHIWDLDRMHYAWLEGDNTILNRSYHLDELETARLEAGITRGVLVQAANHMMDTDSMITAARASNWIAGVVGWLPLMKPEETGQILEEKFSNETLLKGCRHLIHNEKDPRWLLQPEVIESLALLASRNYCFDVVGINTAHLQTVLELVNRIPNLRLTLDHLNQPPISTGERFGVWGDLMMELAKYPNVHIKISGLGTTAARADLWQIDDLKPYMAYALELFGYDRSFCGGDWPVSCLAGSYQRIWDAYKQILGSLVSGEALNKILHTNAGDFYKL